MMARSITLLLVALSNFINGGYAISIWKPKLFLGNIKAASASDSLSYADLASTAGFIEKAEKYVQDPWIMSPFRLAFGIAWGAVVLGFAILSIRRTKLEQIPYDPQEKEPLKGGGHSAISGPSRLDFAAPSKWALFRVMLWKHMYIARKRHRLLTAVWSVLMNCGCIAGLSYMCGGLDAIGLHSVKAMIFALVVPTYLVFAIQGALQCAVVELVSEKESKMKILQEIYGLSVSMYWLSWGVYFGIVAVVCIVTVYTLLRVASTVVVFASPTLFLLIVFAAYAQQFALAAICSVIFDKPQTASSSVSLLNLGLTLMAAALNGWLAGKGEVVRWLAGLMPYSNIFNGLSTLMWMEAGYVCQDGVCSRGLSFATLWETDLCFMQFPCVHADRKLIPAGQSILHMLLDVLLYSFIAWWLEHVWQGEYGTARHFSFCLDPRYLCPRRRELHRSDEELGHQKSRESGEAMCMQDLRKVYNGVKVAVDDMSLDVHVGEIFALLGHNGAGKTTAINCVIGLVAPTAGKAFINGFDVSTELQAARSRLSICPQDNPFYNVFTVRDHLSFFAALQGVAHSEVDLITVELLAALGLTGKTDAPCTSLSGGQKRRLWVATALIGRSSTIFLDEPTSGMDPLSRQRLWDVWRSIRQAGRTIIFTTHYLDEADRLADRKAVLARGRVQASGTSRELKQQFGLEYNLLVEMQEDAKTEQSTSVPEQEIDLFSAFTAKHSRASAKARVQSLVLRHVPAARFAGNEAGDARDVTQVLRFAVPVQAVSAFSPLFIELEQQKDRLGVKHYSIGMTTLEEVFMALGRQADQKQNDSSNSDFWDVPKEAPLHHTDLCPVTTIRGAGAMFRVRVLWHSNRWTIFRTLFMPFLMNMCAFWSSGHDKTPGPHYKLAMYPSMAFGLTAVDFTLSLTLDRQRKCKFVALAQGLSVKSYWLGTLGAHYLTSLPTALMIPILILYFKPLGLYGNAIPLICLEACVAPVGMLLYAYNISFLFAAVELGTKLIPMTNLFLGTIPTLALQMLLQIGTSSCKYYAHALHIVMSIVNPVYAFPGMLVFVMHTVTKGYDLSVSGYFASWCAVPLFGSLVGHALFACLLLWCDARQRVSKSGASQDSTTCLKDEDVLAEEERLLRSPAGSPLEEAVKCQSLHYTYRAEGPALPLPSCRRRRKSAQEIHAVRGVSVGILKGECFGLLGPNGAGKTTALALMTGELRSPSAGKVAVMGNDLSTTDGLEAAYKLLGVCPQIDPLWENLSGRHHLHFYARLKGVPEACVAAAAEGMLRRLGLEPSEADQPASTYSGGMKRKLSLGIALIGGSPLLFLDEPSAAVDAGAKRHMWEVIRNRAPGQTVVLTTHSMEEAEALCDRVAIQVKGQLRCLGSPMHIKHKYGSGYLLELICQQGATQEEVLDFMRARLAGAAELLEQEGTRFVFQLPTLRNGSMLTLGNVFKELESDGRAIGISEYAVTQPSLEQVFIRLAKEQDELQPELEELPLEVKLCPKSHE